MSSTIRPNTRNTKPRIMHIFCRLGLSIDCSSQWCHIRHNRMQLPINKDSLCSVIFLHLSLNGVLRNIICDLRCLNQFIVHDFYICNANRINIQLRDILFACNKIRDFKFVGYCNLLSCLPLTHRWTIYLLQLGFKYHVLRISFPYFCIQNNILFHIDFWNNCHCQENIFTCLDFFRYGIIHNFKLVLYIGRSIVIHILPDSSANCCIHNLAVSPLRIVKIFFLPSFVLHKAGNYIFRRVEIYPFPTFCFCIAIKQQSGI